MSAFAALEPDQRDQNLLASISTQSGVSSAHCGDFNVAKAYLDQAHHIISNADPPQYLSLSWSETNLGNVAASLDLYEESLEWHLKAQTSRLNCDDDNSPSMSNSEAVGLQNLGRAYWLLGRFEEARLTLMKAMELSSNNRAMLALTHFTMGCLARTEKDFQSAKTEYTTAKDIWMQDENSRTHHFYGTCLYKLGCVYLDQGLVEEATKLLRESLVIARLSHQVMTGQYARVLYKLSEALEGDLELQLDAEQNRDEAERLLRERQEKLGVVAQSGITRSRGSGDEKLYEDLVYILWR